MTDWSYLGTTVSYPKGTTLFVQGEYPDRLYLLIDGIVKISIYMENSEEKTLSFIRPQTLFDVSSAIMNTPHGITTTAYTKCLVIIINRNSLPELIERNHEFSWLLINSLARQVKILGSYIIASAHPSATLKVASILLHFSYQLETGSSKFIRLTISHEEIASLTSLSRVSVSISLAFLEKEGLIEKKRKCIVFRRNDIKTWIKEQMAVM